jgi:hypothetical protein
MGTDRVQEHTIMADRRRSGVETQEQAPRAGGPPPGKRHLKLSLPYDVYELLTIHAMKAGLTISEVVEQLAREHLTEWEVIDPRPATAKAG